MSTIEHFREDFEYPENTRPSIKAYKNNQKIKYLEKEKSKNMPIEGKKRW